MKTVLFIDGANLNATAKELGIRLNFEHLRAYFSDGLVRAYYYTAIAPTSEDGHQTIRPLVDWLEYNGYSMVTKPTKQWMDYTTGVVKVKGNMDIELAVHAMELSTSIEHAVIFSGDGDFKSLVLALQRRGVKVTIVSSIETNPPQCSDELRRVADVFIDLADLATLMQPQPKRSSQYG